MSRTVFLSLKLVLLAVVLCAASTLSAEDKIKALIVDGQNNHKWKETTPVLKQILEDSGRFTVDVATTPQDRSKMNEFKPQFDKYDVIVLNYNGDAWPKETNEAFLKFVQNGGGLVFYHAADNAFTDWKAFNEMAGLGGWGGRNEKSGPYLYIDDQDREIRDPKPGHGGSHGPQWAFTLKVRAEDHPIMKGLPKEFRHCEDELYDHMRGPAKNVTILATAFADKTKGGTGNHEPLLLTVDYGKARCFHTMLGHEAKQCKSVSFIITFLRGTEWAATGEVTFPVPEDMPGLETPVYRDF